MDFLTVLYQSHRLELLRYAEKLDKTDGEDIFTDCHLMICAKYINLDSLGYKKLMYTCMKNNFVNRSNKLKKGIDHEIVIESINIEDQMLKNLELAQMAEAFGHLSTTEKNMCLDYTKNRSGAYRSKRSRAKSKLKKLIEEKRK